jgi:glycosyltransferase involved in cell wall biosynthesis
MSAAEPSGKALVHLVIPCYFESGRIQAFLGELCRATAGEGVSIMVVDDGSGAEEQEKMRAVVDTYREHHPHLRPAMMLPVNIGKGGAVHAGWRAHHGEEWLGFVDADGACSATETMRLIGLAKNSAGNERALFASRNHILGHRIERHWYRDVIGRAHSIIVSLVLGIHVHDSQCGLKLLPRRAYESIAPLLEVNDFGFDIELLAALVDSGFPVEEIPIDWHEVSGGKLRLVRDAWKMLIDILKVQQRRKSPSWLEHTGVRDGHESGSLAQ